MFVYKEDAISSSSDIWIPFSDVFGGVMLGKKDLTLTLKGSGGATGGPVDVTMGFSVWGDVNPQAHVISGAAVDTESWTNLTPAIFRVDQNARIGTSELQFTGTTESLAWLDLDGLNADRMKFKLTFTAAPSVTPAALLIKSRRDSL
ncbi:MAG: type I CRISPR-associated protein Cas7 [FCB group bacterium]|nr:type I CRISPR-associated protein Cas7 [FCB group bacterium]